MPNHLADEVSPYLQEHMDNPVDWYPWGEQALALARERDVPVLLSIGYSSCHWCHVMAHESFEDEATAKVLNAGFVNIKVDREERPDVDRIYQAAHHILTHTVGGWPLNMFLDPHTQQPFFGGSYFPATGRYGLPGFTDVLHRISAAWQEKRTELTVHGGELVAVLDALNHPADKHGQLPTLKSYQVARDDLAGSFDSAWGGFADPPKFPMPTTMEFLLEHFALSRDTAHHDGEALEMVIRTLTQIARGGIYDHLGGGFFRYSTDRRWMVPHFEKMLYDNGPLLSLYADALTFGPDALFEAAIRETADWVVRDMQHPTGGYFTSVDADSEGEEGRFYLWRRERVKRLLTEDEYLVIETLYGLDKPANFESHWNLHRWDAWLSVLERLSLEPVAAGQLLASGRAKMFAARQERPSPSRDEKVLPSWNGMMIKGMARAAAQLNGQEWLRSAQRAADFLRTEVCSDGHMPAVWRDGRTRHEGYLDDYANSIDGLLMLLQVQWRHEDYQFALELADYLIDHFTDEEHGGFFFTSHEHETLIHRPKPLFDDSLPSGNAVAARVLGMLGHLSGEQRYLDAAVATLAWARASIEQLPSVHAGFLCALRGAQVPPTQVVIRGPEDLIGEWKAACQPKRFDPSTVVWAIPLEGDPPLRQPPVYLPRMVASEDLARPVAWVCSNLSCSAPIRDLDELLAQMPGSSASKSR